MKIIFGGGAHTFRNAVQTSSFCPDMGVLFSLDTKIGDSIFAHETHKHLANTISVTA